MSTKADLLRSLFSSQKVLSVTKGTPIKAYLLPSTDAHQSEYLADHDFRVKFLTGFTGSNAYVAVTNDKAVLWTDGRYFIQAAEQLVPPFTLIKQGQSDSITVEDFIAGNLNDGDWIGIDPSLHTYENGGTLIKTLKSMGISVASIKGNLVDEFWNDRPPLQPKAMAPPESCIELPKNSSYDSYSDYVQVFVPRNTNYLFGQIFEPSAVVEGSPVQVMKGVKNPVELEGMRNSHIRDSAALVSFLMWLETELLQGRSHSEIELASKIDSMRAAMDKYVDLSFSTISAAGDHAAKPHYHPEGEEGKRLVTADEVYLLDSGAHYRDGTTDVTRTVWISSKSPIPQEFVRHNTLVLKGHINLARIRLDTLSRHAMWQVGLDFNHGTGHGVGHFLNVHEGPASIGFRTASYESDAWIREGMILTIEPGYYLRGKWGTRIENCYEVVRAEVPSDAAFLGFRALTLVPIQTSIIDKSMLTADEINWLNSYHDRVLSVVGKFLENSGKTAELEWLQKQCAHI
ncbi:unnamed protein product [Haemonchus placei]|uniref:Creatinase/aminopeptidase n=1 Tax=Haemonchus placei TaxID=6290 RepID=A0A0N4X120_HAEPC|nr:unnamed protein product [Haemonchus placei]